MINVVKTSGNGSERHVEINTLSIILQAYSLYYPTLRLNCFYIYFEVVYIHYSHLSVNSTSQTLFYNSIYMHVI